MDLSSKRKSSTGHLLDKPGCRTCVSYILRPCYVGMKTVVFVAEMGCEKNMPAVQWMGPCDFYVRATGSDDE